MGISHTHSRSRISPTEPHDNADHNVSTPTRLLNQKFGRDGEINGPRPRCSQRGIVRKRLHTKTTLDSYSPIIRTSGSFEYVRGPIHSGTALPILTFRLFSSAGTDNAQ